MDNSKVKNIIIILLLIADIFLITLVGGETRKEQKEQQSRIASIQDIFADAGITLDKNIDLTQSSPTAYELSRSMETEEKNICRLVGKCAVEDKGAGKYFYAGITGQADFSGSGEFNILFETDKYSHSGDPASVAKEAIKKIKIYAVEDDFAPNSGDMTQGLTLFSTYDGVLIYNAPIKCYFSANRLSIVSGIRPLDSAIVMNSNNSGLDCISGLMTFLQYLRETRHVCSEIKSIKACYFNEVTGLGTSILRPTWRIGTDSGYFFVNTLTGKVEQRNEQISPI